MKRVVVVMFALLGALATSGIAVSSASAATEFLVKGGGSTTAEVGSSSPTILKSKGIEVKCESDETTKKPFTIKNKAVTIEEIDISVRNCKTVLGISCKSTNAEAKTGLVDFGIRLVTGFEEGGKALAYAENPGTKEKHNELLVEVECGTLKIKLTGCFVSELKEKGGFSTTHTLKSLGVSHEAQEPGGSKFNCALKANGEEATLETTQTITSAESIEIT